MNIISPNPNNKPAQRMPKLDFEKSLQSYNIKQNTNETKKPTMAATRKETRKQMLNTEED